MTVGPLPAADPAALAVLATTFVICAVGGLLPFTPMEAMVVTIALGVRPALVAPVLLVATVTQMAAKLLVYAGSGAARHALGERRQRAVDAVRDKLSTRRGVRLLTTFGSAVLGLPPFYAITVAYGALRLSVLEYLIAGTSGRALRLAVMVIAGRLMLPAGAQAQTPATTAESQSVRTAGQGGTTFVLLTGLLGGIDGFGRLERELVSRGNQVIVIDPFRLSLDSADVNFAAMARRVERVLEDRGISDAHVVAHSHGGGVALRLAASAPHRVARLTLIEVGAQTKLGSRGVDLALRTMPAIAKVPGGKALMRRKLIDAVRTNAGRTDWIDAAAERHYADAPLGSVGRVASMGRRLLDAVEPEPVEHVIARLRVPTIVILGDAPHTSGPREPEIQALASLGALLRIERLAGVGYFPHEEAPESVASLIAGPVLVKRVAISSGSQP